VYLVAELIIQAAFYLKVWPDVTGKIIANTFVRLALFTGYIWFSWYLLDLFYRPNRIWQVAGGMVAFAGFWLLSFSAGAYFLDYWNGKAASFNEHLAQTPFFSTAAAELKWIKDDLLRFFVFITQYYLFRNMVDSRENQQRELAARQQVIEQLQKNEALRKELNQSDIRIAEEQLIALNAQMNPHFIFNCMNSIQKYILKNEKTKALEFLQKFSELMRGVLDNSARPKIALDEEVSMLDKYIYLEQQRLDNKFDYHIHISPNLQTDFFEVPGMIIQPYVENAIWHGLMNLPDKGNGQDRSLNGFDRRGLLELHFDKKDSFICCVIQDNGVGRTLAARLEAGKSPGRKSFGMEISRKRLELLRKEKIAVPKIEIEDLEDENKSPLGTKVTLYIEQE
jgi:sensor histidine kinase YesM